MKKSARAISALLGVATSVAPVASTPIVAQAYSTGNYITYAKNYANNAIQQTTTTNGRRHKTKWVKPSNSNYKAFSNSYHNYLQSALHSYKGKSTYNYIRQILQETASDKGYVAVSLVSKGYAINTWNQTQTLGHYVGSNGQVLDKMSGR